MTTTPFKKAWNRLMAKETTTTFTVTVTHPGGQATFGELFTRCGRHKSKMDVRVSVQQSDSKDVPAETKYSKEQKITRMLLKQACEEAGLEQKNGRPNHVEYNLSYERGTRKGGRTYYSIELRNITLKVKFPDGLSQAGEIHVQRTRTSWGYRDPKVIINLVDPNFLKDLTNFIKWWVNLEQVQDIWNKLAAAEIKCNLAEWEEVVNVYKTQGR